MNTCICAWEKHRVSWRTLYILTWCKRSSISSEQPRASPCLI